MSKTKAGNTIFKEVWVTHCDVKGHPFMFSAAAEPWTARDDEEISKRIDNTRFVLGEEYDHAVSCIKELMHRLEFWENTDKDLRLQEIGDSYGYEREK